MSRTKLRIKNTELDNLICNLRGEIGEIIWTWTIFREFKILAAELETDDINKDLENRFLQNIYRINEKLSNEIIACLSELAKKKVGRLNFHFASLKVNSLHDEVEIFRKYIEKNNFTKKRNYDISHKELPETWTERQNIVILYKEIVKGVAMALVLIKKFDSHVYDNVAKKMWLKERSIRYDMPLSPKASYMLLNQL